MNLQKYFKIKWLILAVTLTATVILFTHIPKELIPSQLQESTFDKFFHVLAYGSITFLLILSVKNSFFARMVFLVVSVLLVICIVDEITQPLVGRQASFTDFLADVIGIAIALLFFIIGKRRFHMTATDSISRLCFVSVFCFITGVLVVVATIVSLNILKGPSLFQQQQAARYFFYTTIFGVFEGDYDLEEGFISEDALETLKKYRSRFTDKCSLVINNDPYNQSRQWNGHFSGAAIFPSGDYFSVVIVRASKGFILEKFEPIDWELLWEEILSDTERYYRLGYSPVYYEP
jgi:VanZ family protein